MKTKNILYAGLLLVGLSSCNDYLDVNAPSKYDSGYIFNDKTEINVALNGVYAQLLSSDTYGQNYLTTLCLNSDVDFKTFTGETGTNNSYRRFDCTSNGSEINKYWTQQYKAIDVANDFIYNLEHSDYFAEGDADVMQMYGEAKVIRAMVYHDLVTYFGDIPFSLLPSSVEMQKLMPVAAREEVYQTLIDDLKDVQKYLGYTSNLTVERVSREFCQAMIARMALAAGGYSLHPDTQNPSNYGKMERPDNYKEFYKIARDYCDSVISTGRHNLNLSFRQVFIDECNNKLNNNDDPIFEIPFTQGANGNIGYNQGPASSVYNNNSLGQNIWGEAKGDAALNAFYRFSFDEEDLRRDYVNGLWKYQSAIATSGAVEEGICYPVINNTYTVFNNKWSKLWATTSMGTNSSGNTGINFPYMRYADVLLMFAEAENELNDGPTEDAKAALKQVRQRAFQNAEKVNKWDACNDKEEFLKAVLDERKWEFAGENMRWKDLVRNNMYSEVVYYAFLRYYTVAEESGASSDFVDMVETYDGKPGYIQNLPYKMYYFGGNPTTSGVQAVANPQDIDIYPNTTLDILDICNPYTKMSSSERPKDSQSADFYDWYTDNGYPKNEILYSFYGFVRGVEARMYIVGNNGELQPFTTDTSNLPVVRYILPYPNAAIQRSAGVYKNYYGYKN